MPSDQPNPPRGSWKPARPAGEYRGPEPRWRRLAGPAVGTAARPRWTRAAQVAVAALALLVFAALLAGLGLMIYLPQTVCVVLIGADYAENLAVEPNVYGWQSLHGLADLARNSPPVFSWGVRPFRLQNEPQELRADSVWDKNLERVPENTVLLFLALHGGSDSKGAYLLAQDATASDDPPNRLRLRDVIDRLGQLPARKNKLLLLDATQVGANWPLGMLYNDFARELDDLNHRIVRVPNLVVFSASAASQRSWVSPEWRQTIFAHYVIEGLKGAADETRDGRINALELTQYVRRNVESWVAANRGALQTPVLLPRGPEGEQRARKVDLLLVQKYQPPDPTATPYFTVPPELPAAWQKWQTLQQQVPAPAVYTPHLWRLYQDVLLRYEQLLRAGDTDKAVDLGNRLRALEQEMLRSQHLDLSALTTTLAMPAVAGWDVTRPEELYRQFNEVWDAPPAEYAKRWTQLLAGRGGPDPVGQLRLRLRLSELVVERAAEDPANNLTKACTLLRILDDPIRPRPAEVHFLMMLERDRVRDRAPPPEYFELFQLAVRTRVLAERTALAVRTGGNPYSEQVFAWIRGQVEEADKLRQEGQDLLFASEGAAWEQARAQLRKAEALYRATQAHAEVVSSALAVRDRVLPFLPYVALPLSQLKMDDEAWLRQMENLWKDTHRLVRMLESPNPALIQLPPPHPDEFPPRSLAQQTDVVRHGFQQVQSLGTKYLLELAEADLPKVWRDIEGALRVPFGDPQLRMKLLMNERRMSRRLLIETDQRPSDQPGESPEDNRETAKREARHQGRMALAVLGQRWFDQCPLPPGADRETITEVRHRLETFAVEEEWWKSLARAGEQVGQRWRAMPVVINQLRATDLQGDHLQSHEALRTADRLSRQMRGASNPALTYRPAEAFRRLGVHNLLLWQGRRTLDDHWFAEDPNAAPYYQVAGTLLANDAQRLRPQEQHQPEVAALQRQLNQPGRLVLRGPPRLHITSERHFGATYRLEREPDAAVPAGSPVVWMEAGKYLQPVAPAVGRRLVRLIGRRQAAEPIACRLTSPFLTEAEANPPRLPQVEQTTLTLRALYRGQRLEQQTGIDLHPLPDRIVAHPPPPSHGSLAVRASPAIQQRFGASNGAIAIVLDCSGSMGPPQGEAYGPATKFNEATRALRGMLRRLPKGVTVSLWVFGQAMGSGKTVTDVERTVLRMQAPIAWDPDDPAQLGDLMARVSYPALEAWNESPIMHAMLRAKEDLRHATGFKTLLVLTDGMDNRFANDREFNPTRKDIPTALRDAFWDSGIEVNVVGFKVVDTEEAQARKQFQAVAELPAAGKFYTVNETGVLAAVLDRALRQRLRYWVETQENVPAAGMPEAGLDVSRSGASDQWFQAGLDPRLYKLRVQADRRLETTLAIDRGDLLLVNLTSLARGLEFERLLYAPTDFPGRPYREHGGWRLSALQNQQLGDRGLQMLLTLEKRFDRRETMLQLLKPRETWIEVQPPPQASAPFSVRTSYRSGYPAAAWSCDVPWWPADPATQLLARPRVQVWTNPDQETPLAATLDRGADFDGLRGLANRSVQVEGDPVVIEDVQVEEHVVETRPGVREPRSCLVVRLRHALSRPVWAWPHGLNVAGHEHHFYTPVGSSTGLFWPVTAEQADQGLSSLSLISLATVKRAAEQRGYKLELLDLSTPQGNDIRPEPPISLR
jgi:hypothetical protein